MRFASYLKPFRGTIFCQRYWLSLTFGDRGSSRVMSRLLGAACTSLATVCEQLRPHFEAAATAFRALLPHVAARSALLHQKIVRAALTLNDGNRDVEEREPLWHERSLLGRDSSGDSSGDSSRMHRRVLDWSQGPRGCKSTRRRGGREV
jgi:hypothetical protein